MHRAFGSACLLVAMVAGLFLPAVGAALRPYAAAYPVACVLAALLLLSGRPRLGTVLVVTGCVLLPAMALLTGGMVLTALAAGFSTTAMPIACLPMVAAWCTIVLRWSRRDPAAPLAVLHLQFDAAAAVVRRSPVASVMPRGLWWYAVVFVLPVLVPQALAMRVALGLLVPPVIAASAVVLGALTAAGIGIRRFERTRGRAVVLAP